MKLLNINPLLVMATLTLLVSCNGDDPDPQNNSEPVFTAKINGTPFTGEKSLTEASLEVEATGDYEFILAGGEFIDIDKGQARVISIGIIGNDADDLKSGAEFSELTLFAGFGAIGVYLDYQNSDVYTTSTSVIGDNSAFIKITDLDKSAQIISGEFSFTAEDDNNGTLHEITDGVFRNIKYTIEE